jgi:hypothetical protein
MERTCGIIFAVRTLASRDRDGILFVIGADMLKSSKRLVAGSTAFATGREA